MTFTNTPCTVVSCQAVLLHKVGKGEMKLGFGMFSVYTNQAPGTSKLQNTPVHIRQEHRLCSRLPRNESWLREVPAV